MRILIVTDAWHPQVNGVVRTYENTARELQKNGHQVFLITPGQFSTVPCPGYSSIRLAVFPGKKPGEIIRNFVPDAVHIATEGPLGHAVRSYCLQHSINFTSSFHTQFPEYLRMRVPVPVDWSYYYLRKFHQAAYRTFVPTLSQKIRLVERGFDNIVIWGRGVDTDIFQPGGDMFPDLPRPVFLTAGRVAMEKNIQIFLDMKLPGSKVVVGDGPDLQRLRKSYPQVIFTGYRYGTDLARHIASADVFVFPSVTDTFGIVLLEAMACGVPVAAYPVTGPRDVVVPGKTGMLDENLQRAAVAALDLDPKTCVEYAKQNSWAKCTATFLNNMVPLFNVPHGQLVSRI